MSRSGARPAAKLLVVGATVIAGSLALGFVAGTAVKSPAQALADTAPPKASVLTERVTTGSVVRSVAIDGTVERRFRSEVRAPALTGENSTPVVTRLPRRTGDKVQDGSLLAEVSGRPIIVLEGRLPAFRALMPGSHGPDVEQLQSGLRQAGLDVRDASGTYGASTAEAVADLYERRGYDALETGMEEVSAAEAAVRSAERSWEQARAGGNKPSIRYAAEDLVAARDSLDEARGVAGAQVPAGEIVFVPSLPATVESVEASVGDPATNVLLRLAAGQLVVRGTPLSADLRGLRPGADVQLVLASGDRASGKVRAITTSSSAPDDAAADSPAGPTVTVEPTKRLKPDLAGSSVRVIVTVAKAPSNGLIVPVSALGSTASGETFVTVVEAGQRRKVLVTPGFVGDGVVQVKAAQGAILSVGNPVSIGLGG